MGRSSDGLTAKLHPLVDGKGFPLRLLLSAGEMHNSQAVPALLADLPGDAVVQLWRLAYREASTLAFADAFRAIMVALVIATVLVPLLRKPGPPLPASSAHGPLTLAPASCPGGLAAKRDGFRGSGHSGHTPR